MDFGGKLTIFHQAREVVEIEVQVLDCSLQAGRCAANQDMQKTLSWPHDDPFRRQILRASQRKRFRSPCLFWDRAPMAEP